MIKQKGSILLLLWLLMVTLGIPMTAYAYAQAGEENDAVVGPPIRVGIWSGQANIMISATTDFELVDRETGQTFSSHAAQEKVVFSADDREITVNGIVCEARNIDVVLKGDGGENYVLVNKRRYRGDISIHRTYGKTGLTVINTLPIESYLYGIIAREISPEWPMEAIKAQAVAARTYALRSLNKHQDDGYDVCATTEDQVYGGRESESVRGNKAVDDTCGLILTYQGKIISAYFHSSGGGYTENSENVWGGFQPYLRGVADYDQESPHFKWEKPVTPAAINNALAKAGYNIGSLQAIELSKLEKPPMMSIDRGISGRVKMIRFIGENGSVELTGNKVRSLLGLNSTLFDIHVVESAPNALAVDVTNSDGNRETKKFAMNLPPMAVKSFLNDKDSVHHLAGRPNELILFNGFGWGHGLGMSQWGAKVMAERAPAGDTTYFATILKHYYQGVDIQKEY